MNVIEWAERRARRVAAALEVACRYVERWCIRIRLACAGFRWHSGLRSRQRDRDRATCEAIHGR